jgi:hypothetical protein
VQVRICQDLSAADGRACLRGVAVQAFEREPAKQRALFATCARMPEDARADCREWFGRTLALVTNRRFRCPDAACRAGAARTREPLVTFS